MKTCHNLGNMIEEILMYATRFSGSGDCILATSSFRHSSSNKNHATPMFCFKIIIPTCCANKNSTLTTSWTFSRMCDRQSLARQRCQDHCEDLTTQSSIIAWPNFQHSATNEARQRSRCRHELPAWRQCTMRCVLTSLVWASQ